TCVGNTRTVTPQACVTNSTCEIVDVEIDNARCLSSNFVFEVTFEVESGGSGSYQVVRGNQVLATGTESPIEVILANNSSSVPFEVTVRDANNIACVGNTRTVTPQDCSPCSISQVSVTNAACDGFDFVFDVNFQVTEGSGEFEVIGNGILLASGNSSPLQVRLPANESVNPIS
ncbi:MAG: hypothetical protein HC892_08045, partial [Saprospiraceae bacterium]|nr:hypothetical protein [Saprospiraceae bacterium]